MRKLTKGVKVTSLTLATFIGIQACAVAQTLPLVDQLEASSEKTLLSIITIVALSCVIVVFLIVSTILACRALKENPKTAEFLNTFLTSSNSLQILTVSAVLVTTLFLGLSDRLNDGTLALLSSVAGYVLGSLHHPNEKANDRAVHGVLNEQDKVKADLGLEDN